MSLQTLYYSNNEKIYKNLRSINYTIIATKKEEEEITELSALTVDDSSEQCSIYYYISFWIIINNPELFHGCMLYICSYLH